MDTVLNIPIGENGYTDRESMPAHIEFYTDIQVLGFESQIQGRNVTRPVSMIQFMFPGGKTIFVREATETDKIQYRKQWEQFQANQVQIGDGLPIEQWAAIEKGQQLNLKSMHIHTVEQLANVSDNDLSKIGMGALDLRGKARAFIQSFKMDKKTEELREENKNLKSDIEALRMQMATIMERFRSQSLQSEDAPSESTQQKRRRGRGRPKKLIEGEGNDDT